MYSTYLVYGVVNWMNSAAGLVMSTNVYQGMYTSNGLNINRSVGKNTIMLDKNLKR